ncbi:MAG: SfnB family sulfur acquisition oxidoreductase [Candidatus Velthaea sp.]|jgi:SfnB family sulfur acquisition oxidoreductase
MTLSVSTERPAAHVIRDDAEAVAIAKSLAERFSVEASARDRERRLPLRELDEYSQSGLWGITVPRAYGGAEVSYATVAEVTRIIAVADPSLGQIPQNHLAIVDIIRSAGSEEQKRELFAQVLGGVRFGNAFSEQHSKNVSEFLTRITPQGDAFAVNGRKFYSTGALLAQFVPIVAADENGRAHLAIADRHAPGLSIVDDWDSFGQRTTASGTVVIDNVVVPASRVIKAYLVFDEPTANGPIEQIIHAAIDAGIARAAIEETENFVRTYTRPWPDSGQEHGYEDHYTIAAVGDLRIRLHAAEALLEHAGRVVDAAVREPNENTVAVASIAVAEAKALTTEIAVLAANKLFELAGTRSTLGKYNLDRHWRNARTHTLHDPVRWKYHAVGNYYLNGVKPPRHAWI